MCHELQKGQPPDRFSNLLRILVFAAMDFAMNMRSTKTIWWWAC